MATKKQKTIIPKPVTKEFKDLNKFERDELANYIIELRRLGASYRETSRAAQAKASLSTTPDIKTIKRIIQKYEEGLVAESDFADMNLQRVRSIDDIFSQKKKILKLLNQGWYNISWEELDKKTKTIKVVTQRQIIKPHVMATLHGVLANINEQIIRVRGSGNTQFQMNFLNFTQNNNNIHDRPTEEQREKLSPKALAVLDAIYDEVDLPEED